MDNESILQNFPGKLAVSVQGEIFAGLLRGVAVGGPLANDNDVEAAMEYICQLLTRGRAAGNSVYIIGNGGSAAVASHIANDFVNAVALRAVTLHEPSVLTCMANDYGYDTAYARQIKVLGRSEDILIAISSSGNSQNIRNAVDEARNCGMTTITLTGFKEENPLRCQGDLNLWVASGEYGMVEIAHLFLLHNLADRLRQQRSAETAGR